ncbi:MAG: hemerythrin domain-containing protein, partial [Comamonas sp.]|nr:hemerythrin domain-containing protein [Comamonas sp.]
LVLLLRLGVHLAEHGCDAQACDAAADVQRYFDVAAPLHHGDEELHVFPVLRATGKAALANSLHAEHEQMEQRWTYIRGDLQAVQARQTLDSPALADARRRWADFAALYAAHMRVEETQAYPEAHARLALSEQVAMGRNMAQRRGTRYPDAEL